MDHPYVPVLFVFLVAIIFATVFLVLSYFIGPRKPTASKLSPYECGQTPVGSARDKFSVKFFLVAIIFILFDIETVFLFPWAILYRDFIKDGMGLFMLIEMGIFVLILGIGYLYIWRKKALDWN